MHHLKMTTATYSSNNSNNNNSSTPVGHAATRCSSPALLRAHTVLLVCVMMCACTVTAVRATNRLCTSPMARSNIIFIHNIPEDSIVGEALAHLEINGSPDEISLNKSSMWDPHISFNATDRTLIVAQQLDRETEASLSLTIECKIKSIEVTINVPIEITVQDVNDNPPEFTSPSYTATFSETVPVGTTLFDRIVATDTDSSTWYISYAIEEGEYSSYVSIPNDSIGVVILTRRLDYEHTNTITFTVIATDSSQVDSADTPVVQLSSSVVCTVYVTDGGDQNPVFTARSYHVDVLENTPPNTVLDITPPISAYDPDVDIASPLLYNIIDDATAGYSRYFVISHSVREGGVDQVQLTMLNPPLRRGDTYTLMIQARKAHDYDRFSVAPVHIRVVEALYNPPRFTHPTYDVTMVENTPSDVLVVTVHADDNDVGEDIRYSLDGSPDSLHFWIDEISGSIYTRTVLDHETKQQYQFLVIVSDGQEEDRSAVTVTVLGTNDNTPRFTQNSYHFNGEEETEEGVIGTVQATDADAGSRITYSLLSNSSRLFTIGSSSGVIRFIGKSGDVTQPRYDLVVVATDQDNPLYHSSVLVTVTYTASVGAVSGAGGDGGVSIVVPIVLGVIAALLLIIIILMALYIYRILKNTNMNRFVKSRSFESSLQLGNAMSSSSQLYAADNLGFNNKRHMDLYNQIDAHEGTSQQESPFVPADSSMSSTDSVAPRTGRGGGMPRGGGVYMIDGTTESSSDQQEEGPAGGGGTRGEMAEVHEIQYDTAVTPMGTYRGAPRQLMPSAIGSSGSGAGGSISSAGGPGPLAVAAVGPRRPAGTSSQSGLAGSSSLTTFKDPHVLIPTSEAAKRELTKQGRHIPVMGQPGVSFIDNADLLYPQEDSDYHNSASSIESDRPGITVYY